MTIPGSWVDHFTFGFFAALGWCLACALWNGLASLLRGRREP